MKPHSESTLGPPLFVACRVFPETVAELLNRGASLEARGTSDRWSALHHCARHGSVSCARAARHRRRQRAQRSRRSPHQAWRRPKWLGCLRRISSPFGACSVEQKHYFLTRLFDKREMIISPNRFIIYVIISMRTKVVLVDACSYARPHAVTRSFISSSVCVCV